MLRKHKEKCTMLNVQWCAIEMQRLLHKHYVNGVTLSQDYSPQNTCQDVGLLAKNRYESDLSNEVLYILVGQETAKISEVKVGGRK